MKVVVLAGGFGSRLAELTSVIPKPMVEVGDQPILLHIMKHYAHYGHREFVVALGYKGDHIKRFFRDYWSFHASVTVDLGARKTSYHEASPVDWRVHLIETGSHTGTGGRLARLRDTLREATFMLTYGDGVSDVPLDKLLDVHRRMGRLATVTAVRPPSRFGGLTIQEGVVKEFVEKPQITEGWINGGFMVFEPEVFEYIDKETESLERDLLERLAAENQLSAYEHRGFWQCMDTLRDRRRLEDLWESGSPPWRMWE